MQKLIQTVIFIFSLVGLFFSSVSFADQSPDCTGPEQWPASMAFVKLKNAGITDNNKLDFSKTKTIRLASEKLKDNLYRQVHLITFVEKSGKTINAITVNEASNEECSMSGVDVYVVGKLLK